MNLEEIKLIASVKGLSVELVRVLDTLLAKEHRPTQFTQSTLNQAAVISDEITNMLTGYLEQLKEQAAR